MVGAETTDEQVPPLGVVRWWYQLPVWLAMVIVAVVASTLLAVSVANGSVFVSAVSDHSPQPSQLLSHLPARNWTS